MLLMPDWCFIVDSVVCLKNVLLHGRSESESQFGNCILPRWLWLDILSAERLQVEGSTATLAMQNNLPSFWNQRKEAMDMCPHTHKTFKPFLWNMYTWVMEGSLCIGLGSLLGEFFLMFVKLSTIFNPLKTGFLTAEIAYRIKVPKSRLYTT